MPIPKTLHVGTSWAGDNTVELRLSLPNSRGKIIPEEGATCIHIQASPVQLYGILSKAMNMVEDQSAITDRGTSLGWAIDLYDPVV